MRLAHLAIAALLGAALALSACGIKGDPIRPGSDKDPKKQQQSTG